MKYKQYSRIIIAMAIALALIFTPVFGSYSYFSYSFGADKEQISSQQKGDANEQNGTEEEEPSTEQQATESNGNSGDNGSNAESGSDATTEQQATESNGSNEIRESGPDGNAGATEAAPQKGQTVLKAADEPTTNTEEEPARDAKNSEPVDFDLNKVVTKAAIDATKDASGKYVIRIGTTYSIDLTFKETMDNQFPNGPQDTMTYTLPDGLIAADGDSGKFSVRVNDGGTNFTVKDNTYEVSGNKIIVRFNTSDANFDRMAAAANLTFTIAFEGEFDGENTEIIFEDEVVVDIDVDRSSILEVKKTSDEHLDHSRIDYTIELKSTGVNTDIVVVDNIGVVDQNGEEIVGNNGGISYTPEIVTITQWDDNISFESNKRSEQDLLDLPIWISAVPPARTTFQIPNMLDGEIIKIKYHADVRADRIPEGANGKVYAEANNSVSVESNEDTSVDRSNTTSVIDYTPGITKDGTVDPNDPSILHWTITANDTAKVSMAGKKITDKIGATSQKFLTYRGTGIKIDVFDEQGARIRTDTIPWSSLNCTQNSNGKDVSWSYTIPTSDTAPYKYVITYDTDVDTRGEHIDVTVANTVDIDGDISATGRIKIGPPDGYMSIQKRVLKVDLDNKEITWGIDITAPKGGLETASVVDRHPHTGSIFEQVIRDSISVSGLYQGETYNVTYGTNQTKIDFSYSTGSGTQSGLMPAQSGNSRTVSVTLKTQISDDWLNNFSITSHGNAVDLNGRKSSSDSIVVEKPGITKNAKTEPVGYRNVNGTAVPVYRYELILSHVTKDANTITDEFDTGILEPYTPTLSDSWYKSNDAWYVYGGGTSSQTKKGGSTVSHESTGSGMTISTNTASLPHNAADTNSPKHYYARYKLVYYLTIKDAAIDTVINGAISNGDGKYPINNEAKWDGHTGETEVKYEYPGLKKDILTSDADLKRIDEDIPVEFRIIANPSRKTLNNGNDITLTDTATNLLIDPDTIVIKVDDQVVHNVPYTQSGKKMTYTIPDSKKVEITYSAKVEFSSIGEQGDNVKVEFNNVAEMLGYDTNIKKTASRQNTGTGVASVPQIKVTKFEAGDMNKKVDGAEFKLLDKNKAAVKDKNGDEVTYTTDAEGKFTVRGDMERLGWVLEENEYYYLQEIKSPEGYILTNKLYQFQVSDNGTRDPVNFIFASGDPLTILNYPETAIDVEKIWTDGNELHSADEITVKLQQKIGDGDWSDTIRMIDEENDGEWTDVDGLTAVLNQDNDWKYTFDKLPAVVPTGDTFEDDDAVVDYRVVETLINGKESEPEIGDSKFKETRYTIGEPDAGSDSSKKIAVTNVYVPDIEKSLESTKLFEHGVIDKEAMFRFNIFEVTGTDDQGKEQLNLVGSGETTEIGSSKSAVEFSPIKYTLDDLRMENGDFAGSRVFTYIIRETVTPKTDKNGFDGSTNIQYDTKDRRATVTLKLVDDKLVADVDYGEEETIEFKNLQTSPELTKIDVEKVWTDGNEKHDADNITVTLQQKIGDGDWSDTIRLIDLGKVYTWSDAKGMTATLSKANDWKYTFTNLPTKVPAGEDFTGAYTKAEYRILETEMNGMVPEQNVDGAKYKETTYDVTKSGKNGPMKVTVTNVYVPDTEISLEAVKLFENGELNGKNVFTFDVSEVDNSLIGEDSSKHVASGSTKDGTSTQKGSKGKVYFEPIKYSLNDLKNDDGTYAAEKQFRYVIKENVPSNVDEDGYDRQSDIKYDTKERYATVTLKLVGNELKASVSYDGGETPEFTNTRKPPSTDTGDNSINLLYAVLMILSLSAIAAVLGIRRRMSI